MDESNNKKANRLPLILLGLLALIFIPMVACGGAPVEKSMIGTWALQWPGQPIYWKITKKGSYAISGPGATVKHEGTIKAAKGEWSLKSKTWGEDGGTYEFPDSNTMICVGKLGPGTWKRVEDNIRKKSTKSTAILNTNKDGARLIAKDLPELMETITEKARTLKADAIPVKLEYKHLKHHTYTGPEVKIYYYSPSEGTGVLYTATIQQTSPYVFDRSVNWGENALPPVFVDLPAATRIARKNGLKGPVEKANLRIWNSKEADPILAWMISTGTHGGGRTINAATGDIIDFDVTGYIDSYNAQWAEASKGLKSLLHRSRPRSSGSSSSNWSSSSDSGSSGGYEEFDYDAYNKKVAEENAYWSGDSQAYDRIKNGNCTSSDSTRFGC